MTEAPTSGPDERASAKKLAVKARASLLRAARVDGAAFNAYVLSDEETGGPIELADMHLEWHRLIDDHSRFLIWSHVEGGKTSQISVGRTLFELGRDTSKRIVILSKTQGQSVKIVRSIAGYIERSTALREVFPNLYPSVPWTQTSLMIQREVFSKDFSVQACGVGGVIVGQRIDLLIVDDILDWRNTRTPAQRAELRRWFKSEVLGRLTGDARVIVCGNAYHPEDFLHSLAREGYVSKRYAVTLADGTPRFPKKWNARRIAEKRAELGSAESARQLDCVARKDTDVRCKEEWIRKCLARGDRVPLYHSLADHVFVNGGRSFTGVDIGVGKKKQDAKTVVFSIYIWPNGDVQLVGLDSGRWSGLEIVQRVASHHVRYKSQVFVESNGAQMLLLDFVKDVQVDGIDAVLSSAVLPFNTGANKTHPVLGVESIFAEFEMERWIIPSVSDPNRPGYYITTEEISEWLSECENYDPTRHTGDHLMAAWIARHGARGVQKTAAPEAGAKVIGEGGDPTAVPAAGTGAAARAEALDGWEGAIVKARPDSPA